MELVVKKTSRPEGLESISCESKWFSPLEIRAMQPPFRALKEGSDCRAVPGVGPLPLIDVGLAVDVGRDQGVVGVEEEAVAVIGDDPGAGEDVVGGRDHGGGLEFLQADI